MDHPDIDEEQKDIIRSSQDKIGNYLVMHKLSTKFRGMTYEQGVFDAMNWIIGEGEDPSDEYK